MENKLILISCHEHARPVAEYLAAFLMENGIRREQIICSLLPGKGSPTPPEGQAREMITRAGFGVVLLSRGYAESPCCLQEAGALWFLNIPSVLCLLPGAQKSSLGFMAEKESFSMDQPTGLCRLAECARSAVALPPMQIPADRAQNAAKQIRELLASLLRAPAEPGQRDLHPEQLRQLTEQEQLVLYYFLCHGAQQVQSSAPIRRWLVEEELDRGNPAAGLALLAERGYGLLLPGENDPPFAMKMPIFEQLTRQKELFLEVLRPVFERHRQLRSALFLQALSQRALGPVDLLFVSYLLEEQVVSFGADPWKEGAVGGVIRWERKNHLMPALSRDYFGCLTRFLRRDFLYESTFRFDQTPLEYRLHRSLQVLLSGSDPTELVPYRALLQKNLESYSLK